jgi:5-oxoprolinase (ATP-hydrolysing) subunit B
MSETWHWTSEAVLTLSLPGPLLAMSQRRLLAMADSLRGTSGLLDVVPGLHTISLVADLRQRPAGELELLARQAWRQARPVRDGVRTLVLAVRYGGEQGPDLEAAAHALKLSSAQLVRAHAAPLYEVACLGFLPGFPYLVGLPPELHLPRLAEPRLRVPAGSVGIGGAQTGVYPLASPGGWHLLGRTDQRLFDPSQTPATWLLPGDRLRFLPLP